MNERWYKYEAEQVINYNSSCYAYYRDPVERKAKFDKDVEEQRKQLEYLAAAPEPKIIQLDTDPNTGANTSLHFEVGIVFDSSTLNKFSTRYDKFYPKDHSFTIWRWDAKARIRDQTEDKSNNFVHKLGFGWFSIPTTVYVYPQGAYYEWLKHKRSKPTAWTKVHSEGYKTTYSFGDRIISAHLFFKTEEDFKNWIGNEYYASMFVDLLE